MARRKPKEQQLGSLDGSVPRIESSQKSWMTEGVSAGDVGDIGESRMAMSAGRGSKRPSPGSAETKSVGQRGKLRTQL